MRVASLVLALLIATSALPTSSALAQTTSEDRAVELAHEGLEFFNQGRFADALAAFDQANNLASSPVLGLYTARSLRNLGRLVEASERYRKVLGAELPAGAPKPFVTAQEDAKKELDVLLPRIPAVTFQLVPDAASATVLVDGKSITPAGPQAIDPGSHEVVVTENGVERARRRFELREGDKLARVRVALAPTAPKEPDESTGPRQGSWVPGAVLIGAGGAGLLVGAITGGLAISAERDLAEACPNAVCPAEKQGDLDSANAMALASTISFIAGGAIAATGIVLVILRPGGEDAPAAPAVSLRVSPWGLGLVGAF